MASDHFGRSRIRTGDIDDRFVDESHIFSLNVCYVETMLTYQILESENIVIIEPKLVEHFVGAEVKGFGFNERDEAMGWLKRSD